MITLSTPSRAYHHGNLRHDLVEAGLALLATRSLDDLSLREVARAVGVSATAVYRHFPDKRALMAAMAAAGFARLAAAQHDAAAAAGGGSAGFVATGRAYVRFALAHPALFRMMFSYGGSSDPLSDQAPADGGAMALLRANAASQAGPGDDAKVLALRGWSLAHGLAMLMLDGQVPVDETLIDGVVAGDKRQASGGDEPATGDRWPGEVPPL